MERPGTGLSEKSNTMGRERAIGVLRRSLAAVFPYRTPAEDPFVGRGEEHAEALAALEVLDVLSADRGAAPVLTPTVEEWQALWEHHRNLERVLAEQRNYSGAELSKNRAVAIERHVAPADGWERAWKATVKKS